MSCAVMFQPCFAAADGLSSGMTSTAKTDLGPQTSGLLSSPSSGGFQHPHNSYNMHYKSFPSSYTHPAAALASNYSHSLMQSQLSTQDFTRNSYPKTSTNCSRTSSEGTSSGSCSNLTSPSPERALKKHCPNSRDSQSISPASSSGSIRSPLSRANPCSSTSSNQPSAAVASSSSSSNTQVPSEKDVKYVSANCLVVTHYTGDTSAVVDEHFTRALKSPRDLPTKASPMSLKNFPPSFYQPPSVAKHMHGFGGALSSPSDIYEAYHAGGFHSIQSTSHHDPWAYSFSPQAYVHRGVGHDVYHSAMSSTSHPYQYPSFGFQQPFSRLPTVPMNKSEAWGSRYYDMFTSGASDYGHASSTAIDAASYPYHHNMAEYFTDLNQG